MRLGLVGGLDPTGGAGLLRDGWTVESMRPSLAYRSVATALTKQGRGVGVRVGASRDAVLADQLRSIAGAEVVKVGLVPSAVASVMASWSQEHRGVLVLDPVRGATQGGDLGTSPHAYLSLVHARTILTPNILEARWLAGQEVGGEELVEAVARRSGARGVLLKGGHGDDHRWVCDLWWEAGEILEVRRPRLPGPDVRGTGCALASAVAVGLVAGDAPRDAVTNAIAWLDGVRMRATPGIDGALHLPAART